MRAYDCTRLVVMHFVFTFFQHTYVVTYVYIHIYVYTIMHVFVKHFLRRYGPVAVDCGEYIHVHVYNLHKCM